LVALLDVEGVAMPPEKYGARPNPLAVLRWVGEAHSLQSFCR
jgi:hypothetical protein